MDRAEGPINVNPASSQAWAKRAILAQEPITGMNRICAVTAGGIEYPVDIQIALRRGRCPDVSGFIGLADVQSGTIRVGVNGHGADTHLTQCAYNPQRDLAAIGD